MIEYQILQLVKSARRNWMEQVYKTTIERYATREFEILEQEYPNEYFELIKIEHNETCLVFTTKVGK